MSSIRATGKYYVYVDFVAGEHDDAFTKAYRDLHRKESDTWTKHLGFPAYSCPPLGEVHPSYGDVQTHIMGAVLLAEMGYIGGGTLRVRELGSRLFSLLLGGHFKSHD